MLALSPGSILYVTCKDYLSQAILSISKMPLRPLHSPAHLAHDKSLKFGGIREKTAKLAELKNQYAGHDQEIASKDAIIAELRNNLV